MTLHRTTRTRLTALALAAALALSACDDSALPDSALPGSADGGPVTTLSSGDPVDTGAGSALGSGTGDQAAVIVESASAEAAPIEADPIEEDEPAADTEFETPADAPTEVATGGDCVVGSWVFTTAEIDGYYDQIEADGVTIDVTGDVRVELRADNTFTYTPTFGFTMNLDGLSATGQSSGAAVGTYSAEDGMFMFNPTDDNIDFTVSMMGISMSASELGIESLGLAQFNTAYSCVDGVPVFQYQTLDGTHPVSLERA